MSTFEDRCQTTTRMLAEACQEHAFTITGDMRISEAAVADLLGITQAAMKQKRIEGRAPRAYGIGTGNGSRVSYRLADIAAWIEASYEEFS